MSGESAIDPLALTQALIRCPSVTPAEGGALALLERTLAPYGFRCARVDRAGIPNLFARWGDPARGPTLAFGGHTDVVPIGDAAAWTVDPFGAELRDGMAWGRGAVDMKSGVAAFVAAAAAEIASAPPSGSIALLITGDEEGENLHGTRAILDWIRETGEPIDHCLVGEPTSVETFGDQVKIGRRGSMTADIWAHGTQGHAAYPERSRNPLPPLVRALDELARAELDAGSAHFGPSTLTLTTIDVGNPANNVIPAKAFARANIRFNDHHSSASLGAWIRARLDHVAQETGVSFEVSVKVSGESFLTEPGPFSDALVAAVTEETGRAPRLGTGGGTSDARFIKDLCPVVEFGLVGATMHAVDERASIAEIEALTRVYRGLIRRYFQRASA